MEQMALVICLFARKQNSITAPMEVYMHIKRISSYIWGRYLSCSTGVTVNTLELYTRSGDVESSGTVEVFEWTAGDPIKQIVTGKVTSNR